MYFLRLKIPTIPPITNIDTPKIPTDDWSFAPAWGREFLLDEVYCSLCFCNRFGLLFWVLAGFFSAKGNCVPASVVCGISVWLPSSFTSGSSVCVPLSEVVGSSVWVAPSLVENIVQSLFAG